MKEECLIRRANSDRETIELGARLGQVLKPGDVIALAGELGSGKTWFTKGVARGLGVPPEIIVTSPSFSLVNEYEGRCPLFHIDAYRLKNLSEFLAAGLEEYFFQGGVVAMEWADRWPEIIPDLRLKVGFAIVDRLVREIILSGHHPRAREILKAMRNKGAPEPGAEIHFGSSDPLGQ